ncbi:MAG: histidine kinase [Christensenellales bacterium]
MESKNDNIGFRRNGKLKYRTWLILFFLLSMGIVLFAGLYIYNSSQLLMRETSQMFDKNNELTEVYNEVQKLQAELETYLSTSSSDSLLSFYEYMGNIGKNVGSLLSNADNSARGVKIKNVSNMIQHYLTLAEDTANAKRGRNTDAYISNYRDTVKINGYISDYIKGIMSGDLTDSAAKYLILRSRMQNATIINYLLLGCICVFAIGAIVVFSREVTKPITRLSDYASEISRGNFDIVIEPSNSGSEIDMLYKVFDLMVINIRDHVNQLQEKRRLERTLHRQKMNNLVMQNALHEAELLALQSQMNPHFIFNTISIGANIAMLQGDDVVRSYLENAADIFRYNLKGLESYATLQEEIDNAVAYMYVLKARFGDSIEFEINTGDDPRALKLAVPHMMLQPIIENAYIHGISGKEEGGRITLHVESSSSYVYVTVSDTGPGMSNETIDALLKGESKRKKPAIGHTTGIGIDNVLRRLRMIFETQDVMDIKCNSAGTRIIFKLPYPAEEGDKYVQRSSG